MFRVRKTFCDASHFLHPPFDDPPPTLCNGGYIEDAKGRDKAYRPLTVVVGCDKAHLVLAIGREWCDFNIGVSSDLQIESAPNGATLQAALHRPLDAGA